MKKYLFICFCFFSCQEEIFIDFNNESSKIVVEGGIEQGMPPYVVLSKNQGYFDEINNETYENLFINDAIVKVWPTYTIEGPNDTITLERSAESPLPIYSFLPYWSNIIPPNASEDPFFKNWSIPNRTYNLLVVWNNQEITSQTTIPNPTPLDCLWVEKNEFSDKDFKYDVRAFYNDPINEKNNILIKNRRLEHWKLDSLVQGSREKINVPDIFLDLIDAGSDILINGQRFETYFPRKGDADFPTKPFNGKRWKTYNFEGNLDSTELPGDIAIIKFCQIDEPSLKFWRSLVRQFGSNGNPFQEPLNLVSNINGGYGGWTGYGVVYYKIPIIDGYHTDTPLPLNSVEIIDLF